METKPTIFQTVFSITAAVVMFMAAIGVVLQDIPAFSGTIAKISALTIQAEVILLVCLILASLLGGITVVIYRFARH